MTKKIIAQLVEASYTKDELDGKKVDRIAKILSRQDLKIYIRGLKLAEKARTISLVLPDKNLYNKTLVQGVKKRVKVIEDPSLLLGFRIIDNDMVHDMSLKNRLENFVTNI